MLFGSFLHSQCLDVNITTTNATCSDPSSGQITIQFTNVVFPVTYTVNNGSMTNTSDPSAILDNLQAGDYVINVQDNTGCQQNFNVTVSSSQIPIAVPNPSSSICGENCMLIDMNATTPVSFTYAGITVTDYTSSTYEICSNSLPPGDYLFTLTDANGCTTSFDFSFINDPFELTITETPLTCSSATLTSFVNTNTNVSYQWNTGETTQEIIATQPGTYWLRVEGENGCSDFQTYDYITTNNMDVTVTTTDVSCGGAADGSVFFDVNGGVSPYQYSIIINGLVIGTTPTITGLTAGTYQIQVTDAEGCIIIETFTISEPPPLIGEIWQNDECSSQNLFIEAIATGGTAPYQYLWDNGEIGPVITPTNSGFYSVTIEDSNGCNFVLQTSFVVTAGIGVNILNTTNATCGQSNGAIDFEVFGDGPFTIQLNGQVLLPDVFTIENLAPGDYVLTIDDINGCTDFFQFQIQETYAFSPTLELSDPVCTNEGFITVFPNGSSTYIYEWSNGEMTETISNLEPGTYSVTVTDAEGCQEILVGVLEGALDYNVVTTVSDCEMDNGTATIDFENTPPNAEIGWSTGATNFTSIGDLAPGGYSVTVTDTDTGCREHQVFYIEEDSLCFSTISGFVYIDAENEDCVFDATTVPAPNVLIELSDGQQVTTNQNGYYEFQVDDLGTYTISINDFGFALEPLCADPIDVTVDDFQYNFSGNNFYTKYGDWTDVRLTISKGPARPGFTQNVWINVKNIGSRPASGEVNFTHPDIQNFTSANPDENSYDINNYTISWNYDNLIPGAMMTFRAYLVTPATTPLGTILDYSATATTIDTDVQPENNTDLCQATVVGSYDPNDKQVSPDGFNENGGISMADSVLTYRIRFQNTGTDTAFTVVVRDTIDPDLDMSTFNPLGASHDYQIRIENNNEIAFIFENIMLPDSNINEPLSHGYLLYEININRGSDYGTQIDNTAAIYFDFNAPIITNTVTNIIEMETGLNDTEWASLPLNIAPNPTTDKAVLSYSLESSDQTQIELYDIFGKRIQTIQPLASVPAGQQEILIDLEGISQGVYWIRVTAESGVSGAKKVVLMK